MGQHVICQYPAQKEVSLVTRAERVEGQGPALGNSSVWRSGSSRAGGQAEKMEMKRPVMQGESLKCVVP